MNQQFKFKITGKFLIPGEKDTDNIIKPENIVSFIRMSDYRNKNQATTLLRINLDKNLYDKIIKNAKTSTLYLKVDKYNYVSNSEAQVTESIIDDEFSIFVSHDLNYYKEIDYLDKQDDGKDRKDIYREAYIGIMSKKCIDANKCIANTTVNNTTMMDTAVSYMKDLHLLVEPFTYNKSNAQLIIPPIDTLAGLIHYLDNIESFYSTKYLFFIDEPYCTYLISRSGNGIPKKNEKYNDVNIIVHPVTDKAMAIEGILCDDTNKCYQLDMSVADTKYNINHDVAKIIDKIDAVINPGKDDSVQYYANVEETQKIINAMMEKFKNKVKLWVKHMGNAPEIMKNLNKKFNDTILNKAYQLKKYEDELVEKATEQVLNIPTALDVTIGKNTINVPVVQDAIKKECSEYAAKHLNIFGGVYDKLSAFSKNFEDVTNKTAPLFYDATYLDNYLNAVTAVNAQDVIEQTKKSLNTLNSKSDNNNSIINTTVFGRADDVLGNVTGSITNIADKVSSIATKLQSVQDKYGKYLSDDTNTQFDDLKYNTGKLSDNITEMQGYVDTAQGIVSNFSSLMGVFNSGLSGINSLFSDLTSIKDFDLKSKFVSLVVDTRTIGMQSTTVIDQLKNINNTELTYIDYKNLSKDLDSVLDLTGIGKIGVANIQSDVKVGGLYGNGKIGTKIVISDNDNPNSIKGYKHELETSINSLNITKYDLDPTIFTPNKKYHVKNYGEHKDKDGIFILNKKIEIYTREDTDFRCTVSLDLAKIVENTNNTKAEDMNNTNNNTKKEDWYKQTKGEDTGKTNTVVSTNSTIGIGDLNRNKQVNRSVKKLEFGSNSSSDLSNYIKKADKEDLERMGLILH